MQLWGARLETASYRWIKISYAVSLGIVAVLIWFLEVQTEEEFGYAIALMLIIFNMFLGSLVRLIYLQSSYEDCSGRRSYIHGK